MQTRPVITSAAMSVSDFMSVHDEGSTADMKVAIVAAADVITYDSLKPTPVSVTTPMTMPTVPAAAPTASAYLAPVSNASMRSGAFSRPRMSSFFSTNGETTTIAMKSGSESSPDAPTMTTPSSACSTSSAT